jgi:glycosyltransferase involved in cell wall biosynthesis
MKLIIQVPCLNEAETLPATVADLPRHVEGFDSVELMIIDDGSTDGTADVARSLGVEHVVRMNGNQGLARAFVAGLVAAVERGADVVVNTDADNQYMGEDIAKLVKPILEGNADIVIGARPIPAIQHFSPVKRLLQRVGSHVVRAFSGTRVHDAPSGFRAMTREAALRLNVFNGFTYTIETIIQAGLSNLRITSVPIRVNGPTRPSRLFRGNLSYIRRSIITMLSVYLIYRPTRLFGALALAFFLPGLFLAIRYVVMMFVGEGTGHVQSVIACAVLGLSSLFMAAIGVVAHLLSINRRLLEEIRYMERSRRLAESRPAPTANGHANGAPMGAAHLMSVGSDVHG